MNGVADGLLSGVRVVDLSTVLAGPFAGYQLGLLGAEVVKVEVPGAGDLARQLGAAPELSARQLGASFLAQNAGKRSVTVNLKDEAGKEVLRRLVASADVLLENFRPGVLERLGFGWEELREVNPGLVYCAVSGFGGTGPMRERPAYDQIIQGLSGIMSITGAQDSAPLRVGHPVCDTTGGLTAAFAVAAALLRRERTGQGCHLDVSMLEAALTTMGWVVSDHLLAGREPVPMGNENRTAAPSGTFETAEGRLNIAANTQPQFESLCRHLGRTDLLEDSRFAAREDRKCHRHELRAELERTLRTRTAAEWDEVLAGAGVPAAPVLSVGDALRSEQVRQRGLVHQVPSPAGGVLELLGSAAHVDGAAVGPAAPPPRLGEHTDQVLHEVGYDDDEICALRRRGAV